jgi:hypothetical protein
MNAVGHDDDARRAWARWSTIASWAITVCAVILALVAGILLRRTFYGDPSIYLPYARNIANGDFFSYNPHQFSSGSTSPLWAVILSIGYLLGGAWLTAKAIAIAATVTSLALTVWVAGRITGAPLGAAIGGLYLMGVVVLPGSLMYESPLAVGLVALSLLAACSVATAAATGEDPSWRQIGLLGATWAAIPLARPDATIVVVLEALALWRGGQARGGVRALPLAIGLAVAAIPALTYFGYSEAHLGTWSVSSQNRAFALKETASTIGPFSYSTATLRFLASHIVVVAAAAYGCVALARTRSTRWLGACIAGGFVAYVLLLTVVSPVTDDADRYLLPTAPLIAVAVAAAFGQVERRLSSQRAVALVTVAGLVLIGGQGVKRVIDAIGVRNSNYPFAQIMEEDLAHRINAVAPPGATVLGYEVQDRYFLRRDIDLISLDGITDGKVAPYLERHDMGAFLRRYRPTYWAVNDAVNYRPFLVKSILHGAARSAANLGVGKTVTVAGIHFQVVARRPAPPPAGFAGWTLLLHLTY